MENGMQVESKRDKKEKELTDKQRIYWEKYIDTGSSRTVASDFSVSQTQVLKQLKAAANKLGFKRISDALPEDKKKQRIDRTIDDSASASDLFELLQRQNYRCALTGVELHLNSSALDHIVPVSKGGDDLISNLQWVTSQVNQAKGTMGNDEFIATCKSVAINAFKKELSDL